MPGLWNWKKKAYRRAYYEKNKDELKQALRERDPSKKLEAQKISYQADPSKKLQAQKISYEADPSRKNLTRLTRAKSFRLRKNLTMPTRARSGKLKEKITVQRKRTMQDYYRRCCSCLLLNKQKGYYKYGISKRASKLVRCAMELKKLVFSYSLHEPKQYAIDTWSCEY